MTDNKRTEQAVKQEVEKVRKYVLKPNRGDNDDRHFPSKRLKKFFKDR